MYAFAGTTVAMVLGLWAALVVRQAFRGRRLVRGLLLFPYVVPVVAAALLWRTMLNPQYGIVNSWLESLGGQPVNFLLQSDGELFGFKVPLAFTVVVLFEGWRSFPFAFLFILARLQAIPEELEEAAIVDGATPLQRFRYVLMPELKAVFATIFLLRFIWTFNAFDEVFLLTGRRRRHRAGQHRGGQLAVRAPRRRRRRGAVDRARRDAGDHPRRVLPVVLPEGSGD